MSLRCFSSVESSGAISHFPPEMSSRSRPDRWTLMGRLGTEELTDAPASGGDQVCLEEDVIELSVNSAFSQRVGRNLLPGRKANRNRPLPWRSAYALRGRTINNRSVCVCVWFYYTPNQLGGQRSPLFYNIKGIRDPSTQLNYSPKRNLKPQMRYPKARRNMKEISGGKECRLERGGTKPVVA